MCKELCENSEHSEQMVNLEEEIAIALERPGVCGGDESMSNTPSNRSRNPSRFSVDGALDDGPTCSRYLDNDPLEQMRFVLKYIFSR